MIDQPIERPPRIFNQRRPLSVVRVLGSDVPGAHADDDHMVNKPQVVRKGRNTLATLCGGDDTRKFMTVLVDAFSGQLANTPRPRPVCLGGSLSDNNLIWIRLDSTGFRMLDSELGYRGGVGVRGL